MQITVFKKNAAKKEFRFLAVQRIDAVVIV